MLPKNIKLSLLAYLKKNFILLILDDEYIQRISNHTVHIEDSEGSLNPSSFFPFCAFGNNMTLMGRFDKEFNMTVCDKFTPTVLDGRLCYKVDVNSFVSDEGVKTGPENGLTFVMDYNEDRMIETDKTDKNHEAMIYIDTLGTENFFIFKMNYFCL